MDIKRFRNKEYPSRALAQQAAKLERIELKDIIKRDTAKGLDCSLWQELLDEELAKHKHD